VTPTWLGLALVFGDLVLVFPAQALTASPIGVQCRRFSDCASLVQVSGTPWHVEPVAQPVEQRTFNPLVEGSIPSRLTGTGLAACPIAGYKLSVFVSVSAWAADNSGCFGSIARPGVKPCADHNNAVQCPYRLVRPRTSAFHAGNAGSNPAGDTQFVPVTTKRRV
jgi:hypothetical protein